MIIENNTAAKRFSKELLIPVTSKASSVVKNVFQRTVNKCPSDPALLKTDETGVPPKVSCVTAPPSSSSSSSRSKKSVRFDDILLRKQVHTGEDDEVNPREIWYTLTDFKEEANRIQVIIQQVRRQQQQLSQSGIKVQRQSGVPPHPELRGVEDLVSPQDLRCRKMRMNQVRKGVLLEQKRQKSQGMSNPLLLSVGCREFSIIAQQLAVQRAKWDAKEAAASC